MNQTKCLKSFTFLTPLAFRVITHSLALLLVGLLQGCEQIGYYSQAISGHLSIMANQEYIEALINDPNTNEKTKKRMKEVISALDFAEQNLGMPQAQTNYRKFVQLEGKYPIWSVVATPDDSLAPRQWCYPFVGCASYRGYYAQQDAKDYAQQIFEEGNMDVHVGGADAYSTLGWFNDPVLSTFFRRDEVGLHALLFHELAHQVLYLKGDSTFNESFASAVEESAVELWLKGQTDKIKIYEQRRKRSSDFIRLLKSTQSELETLYNSDLSRSEKLKAKATIIQTLKENYQQLKENQWSGYAGYDGWFNKPINNARLALVNTYSQWVPAFKNWIEICEYDYPAFYQAATELSEQPKERRQQVLENYAKKYASHPLNQADSYTKDAESLPCKYSPNS
ncbi:aminopeptidase [Litoribacillus peritrichatus]|uniref:Aminopeptidase n=1 Tax=Litoribacillus peritrichatus TaxID=718191 RepID=A0ABP7M5U0_9GAMM